MADDDYGQDGRTKASSDPRLTAMLAVASVVADGGPLAETLDRIAEEVTRVVSARAASILQLAGERFRIVGSHGLSPGYRRLLDDWPMPLAPGHGPAGHAVRRRRPALVEDVERGPEFEGFQQLAVGEGYRSAASFPLMTGSAVLGVLTIYRTAPGPWSPSDVQIIGSMAEHAAVVVRTAELIAEQRRHVITLQRLVDSLRAQTHEHANRLHAIGGLLILGEASEALGLVRELSEAHIVDRAMFEGKPRSGHPLLGLLWVETVLARQQLISLEMSDIDDLDQLPLTGAQSVTIVGNLLDNAFDAVAEMPKERRRVEVSIRADAGRVHIRVRDWGPGLSQGGAVFESGHSTKADHAGVGLSIVAETIRTARGRISVEHHREGVAFLVTLPISPA